MTTVTVVAGLPGSGKSTLAKSLPGMRFNLDDLRAMVGMDRATWSREQEDVIVRVMLDGAKAAIKAGTDIVIENTHVVPRLPRLYRKELGPLGVDFVVHDLTDIPVEECIKRDSERDDPVGEAVIRKLADRHADATKNGWRLTDDWMNGERYATPEPYVPDASLPSACIVDLDGTVAIHGDERGHFEYEKVGGDTPNEPVIELVQALLGDPRFRVLFMSGREDRCRDDTEAWLRKHLGVDGPLFMRTTGDHRPDYVVKTELFDQHVREKWDVRFAIDDRNQVVEHAWRAMGIVCLQCAEGAF